MRVVSGSNQRFSWTHSAWDPTEPIATRPLFMLSNPGSYKFFYTFDGNKNVSELVHFESRNGIAAHYDYAPFGAVTRVVNTSTISDRNFHLENPFRFSSEYYDDTLGLVYYNYRHYNPIDGRWCGRDPLDDIVAVYLFVSNQLGIDWLGLQRTSNVKTYEFDMKINKREVMTFVGYAPGSSIAHQIEVYKKEMIEDDYHVTLTYEAECTEEAKAHIHIISVEGNLVGQFDAWGVSLMYDGVGVAYSGCYEVTHSNVTTNLEGKETEIDFLVKVYKAKKVGAAIWIFSLGDGIRVTRELVGERKVRLNHSCCK